ncbi:MAG: hypothetical protein RSD23_09800, partial [Ruthenibacterium sp.]
LTEVVWVSRGTVKTVPYGGNLKIELFSQRSDEGVAPYRTDLRFAIKMQWRTADVSPCEARLAVTPQNLPVLIKR